MPILVGCVSAGVSSVCQSRDAKVPSAVSILGAALLGGKSSRTTSSQMVSWTIARVGGQGVRGSQTAQRVADQWLVNNSVKASPLGTPGKDLTEPENTRTENTRARLASNVVSKNLSSLFKEFIDRTRLKNCQPALLLSVGKSTAFKPAEPMVSSCLTSSCGWGKALLVSNVGAAATTPDLAAFPQTGNRTSQDCPPPQQAQDNQLKQSKAETNVWLAGASAFEKPAAVGFPNFLDATRRNTGH